MALENIERKNYISILGSDATFRQTVSEDTDGAIKREYETSTGAKGFKFEKKYERLTGIITEVSFFDGEYGKLLQITIDGLTLSVPTASNFGEDIMKKLPNIDMTKPVVFTPYSLTDEKGKTKKGVSITQDGKKITNFFRDEVNKKNINGFPDPTGDEKNDKDLWKIYFITARKFLENYIQTNFCKIVPEVSQAQKDFDEITADDVKFN